MYPGQWHDERVFPTPSQHLLGDRFLESVPGNEKSHSAPFAPILNLLLKENEFILATSV